MKIHLIYVRLFGSFLISNGGRLSKHPNGQNKYIFPTGLVMNVYETTGTVTIQGKNYTGKLKKKIDKFINTIKA
jgi:hypothetical protein